MLHPLGEDCFYVAVCQGIKNAPAIPAEFYQTHLLQDPELVGDRRLAHAKQDGDVADDIFQETFIKAVRVIDEGRYTDNGRFLSWILRIAHNQVIDHFRAQKQNRQLNEAEAGYDVLGTLRLAERTVEAEIVCEQIAGDVRRMVELLPDEQREVVMMRYYSGLSFKEIAEQTGVSINTALGRMRYALINLRKMIKEKNLILS